MSDLCPHGVELDAVWSPADPPNCRPCFDALSADLDELELDDPVVRATAIRLADVTERLREGAEIQAVYDRTMYKAWDDCQESLTRVWEAVSEVFYPLVSMMADRLRRLHRGAEGP